MRIKIVIITLGLTAALFPPRDACAQLESVPSEETVGAPSLLNTFRGNLVELKEKARDLLEANDRMAEEKRRLELQAAMLQAEIDLARQALALPPKKEVSVEKAVIKRDVDPEIDAGDIRYLRKKRDALQRQVNDLREKVNRERRRSVPLETRVSALRTERQLLQKNTDQFKRERLARQKVVAGAHSQMIKEVAEREDVRLALGREALMRLRRGEISPVDIKMIEKDNRQLESAIRREQDRNERLRRELQRTDAQAEQAFSRQKEVLERLRQRRGRLTEENQDLTAQLRAIEDKIASMRTAISLHDQTGGLLEEAKTLEAQNTVLKDKLLDLKTVLEALRKETAMIQDLLELYQAP